MVGATGFEPATPCAQGRCATRLRYAPTARIIPHPLCSGRHRLWPRRKRGPRATRPGQRNSPRCGYDAVSMLHQLGSLPRRLRWALQRWNAPADRAFHDALFASQRYDPFTFAYPGYVTIRRFADLAEARLGNARRAVDLGCGPGEITCEIARRRPDIQITGIDHSSAAIARAREHAARLELPNVTFEAADIAGWQPASPADLVMMFDAFHHVLDPAAFVRHLKADRFFLIEPGGDWLGGWARTIDLDWIPNALDVIRARIAWQLGATPARVAGTGPVTEATARNAHGGEPVEHRYTLDDLKQLLRGLRPRRARHDRRRRGLSAGPVRHPAAARAVRTDLLRHAGRHRRRCSSPRISTSTRNTGRSTPNAARPTRCGRRERSTRTTRRPPPASRARATSNTSPTTAPRAHRQAPRSSWASPSATGAGAPGTAPIPQARCCSPITGWIAAAPSSWTTGCGRRCRTRLGRGNLHDVLQHPDARSARRLQTGDGSRGRRRDVVQPRRRAGAQRGRRGRLRPRPTQARVRRAHLRVHARIQRRAAYFQSAMKTLVSPSTFPSRFDAKTRCLPSGENMGKPSNVSLKVIRSRPVPSRLIM